MREAELQRYVVDDIKSLRFRKKIEYGDVSRAAAPGTEPGSFWDRLVFGQYRENVRTMLDALDDDLELIDVCGSISMGKSRLMPDILAYGVNSEQYFIFELKTSSQTSRQALTELYAYEQELQNHFPALGRRNIHKIIISTDFNSTLLHAVSNALLKGDSILCLAPAVGAGAVEKYTVRNALEWDHISFSYLSKELLEGITWCFYQACGYKAEISEREAVQDMRFAIDYLKDVESGYGGSGVCFAWKRKRTNNEVSPVSTDFGITVFDINPYFISARHLARQKDHLSKYATESSGRREHYEYSGLVLKKSEGKVQKLLSDKYSVFSETCLTLSRYEEHMKDWYVIHTDAWGALGREMRTLYYNQRGCLFQGCGFGEHDVFSNLLTQMFLDYPYRQTRGQGEAFWLGVYTRGLTEAVWSPRLKKAELECVRRLWNVICCTVMQVYPEWIEPGACRVNNRRLPYIRRIAEQVRRRFEERGGTDKNAFDMGWRYAGWFKETDGTGVPEEIGLEDLELIVGDEMSETKRLPQALMGYFAEHLNRLMDRCHRAERVGEHEISFLWNIFEACDIQYFDKPEQAARFIKENACTLDSARIPWYVVLDEMRELLNLEGCEALCVGQA